MGCSVTNLALAWVIYNRNVSVCILGASKPYQIEHNFGALEVLSKLNETIIEEIESILNNKPKRDWLVWSDFGRNLN